MTDTNKTPDPKRKPAADQTNQPPMIPFLSHRDRIERRSPARFSVTPQLRLGMTEKTLYWFQATRPNGTATAVNFARTDTHTLIVPAQVGDLDAVPLHYTKRGRTAWCEGHLGFYPEDIPLLQEGTVHFDAEQLQLPDGTPCLGVNYATAKLAKTVKTPAKRKRKSGNQHGTPGATLHQVHMATAAAQAEAMRLLAQAKAVAEAAAASQAAAIQAAAHQAKSGPAATNESEATTPPDAEKPDTQA